LRVSPRTGGHNWQTVWLQGNGTVILDCADINHVRFDEDSKTVSAGPGATNVNGRIPPKYFFPTGHCPMVPLGGFILGNGYGCGFPKYGFGCASVVGMEVVLASGEIRRVNDTDEEGTLLMNMMRGSFHHFPAVITEYVLKAHTAPKCVLPQALVFEVKDWRTAIKAGRDIMHRGASDNDKGISMETSIVFTHYPTSLIGGEDGGMKKVVLLSLMAWSDKEEDETKEFVKNLIKDITGTIVPSKPGAPIPHALVAKQCFEMLYPANVRYLTEAYIGGASSLAVATDEEIYYMVEPVADAWMSPDGDTEIEGLASHSLVVLFNTNMDQVNGGCKLISGFVPGMEVMHYSIYEDPKDDEKNLSKLKESMKRIADSDFMWTVPAEGNIRTGKPCFGTSSYEQIAKSSQHFDPEGLFLKK